MRQSLLFTSMSENFSESLKSAASEAPEHVQKWADALFTTSPADLMNVAPAADKLTGIIPEVGFGAATFGTALLAPSAAIALQARAFAGTFKNIDLTPPA